MSDHLSNLVSEHISAGGKAVLIEAFASHVVIVIARSGNLLVFQKKDLENLQGDIIGVGIKLLSTAAIEKAMPVLDKNEDQFKRSPARLLIPIGTYEGPVSLSLSATNQSSREFVFNI